ncbi:hypothetical protein ECC02_000870 [Trypanosoma cruzi]|uniref:Nucleoplasmin-like domain-containing protein n=3 Tax=Trypanosoma cruzi TaxID=5693 RepID=Q4E3S2_TRYCC|nr:hypothetical protein, conserved [Trypanosoma cruzi]EAN99424.1 hypothetical protein, conserved [Trypanosoma cruzi]KAF5225941.1 hypothetical protein ECC02_000870 [Trypanosoma cruzi]|eukprot:XP_821275.1 hypothetical protein [Trypanosoma cruzi strain CL Brener]
MHMCWLHINAHVTQSTAGGCASVRAAPFFVLFERPLLFFPCFFVCLHTCHGKSRREEMSLHCFFGVAMRPDGVPVTPPMPPNSSLVLSHCALTSTTTGPVTLYVQSHDQPHRFAVCTLSPKHDIYYVPLQLVFTQKVSFILVAAGEKRPDDGSKQKVRKDGKNRNGKNAHDTPTSPENVVHLTGYFESDEGHLAMASDNDDEDDEDDLSDSEGCDGDVKRGAEARGASGRKNGKLGGEGQKAPRNRRNTSKTTSLGGEGNKAGNNHAGTRKKRRRG